MLFVAVSISAISTYLILSGVSALAKNRVSKVHVPAKERFEALGYTDDTVTQKKNYLFSVIDNGKLCKTVILGLDLSKHSLNILEIPPQTQIIAGGFTGSVYEAFETEVYKEIISKSFCLKISGSVTAEVNAFSGAVSLVGGVELDFKSATQIKEHKFTKGKRTIVGEIASIIASDDTAYISGDEIRYYLFKSLLSSFASKLSNIDALEATSLMLGIIVNEVETDFKVGELIELVSLFSKVKKGSLGFYILPGSAINGGYYVDQEELLSLLNENFIAKDFELEINDLNFPIITTEV